MSRGSRVTATPPEWISRMKPQGVGGGAAPEGGTCSAIIALGERPTPELMAAFWAGAARTSPLVEPDRAGHDRVTFVWRGEAEAVFVALNRVTHELSHAALRRLPETDLWHRTFVMPRSWRSSYSLLAAGRAQLAQLEAAEPRWAMRMIRERGSSDPRNPNTVTAHAGAMSEVALAEALTSPLLRDPDSLTGSPSKEFSTSELATTELITTDLMTPTGRRAWLLEPGGPPPSRPRPLVVALDGEVWHANGAVRRVLHNLARGSAHTGVEKQVPAVLLLDAEGPRRMEDFAPTSEMPREIAHTLLPWIRGIAPVSHDRNETAISGESLGGLTALRTAFSFPEQVRHVIAQSSSLWAADLTREVAPLHGSLPQRPAQPLSLSLSVGNYEGAMLGQHRSLHEALQDSGHEASLHEFTGGHDMGWWAHLWADAVSSRWGEPPSTPSP